MRTIEIEVNGKMVKYRDDGRFTTPKNWTYEDQKELLKVVSTLSKIQ